MTNAESTLADAHTLKDETMAWIKMRTNLATDGRVVSIARAVRCKPTMVIGALFILWSIADGQTEDGSLPGHDAASIDGAVGIKGFSDALAAVGWLDIQPSGVTIPRFADHNGASAKRRIEDAKRKATKRRSVPKDVREVSAECPHPSGQIEELEKRREEKRRTPPSEQGGVGPPPSADEPSPVAFCATEARIRRWVGDRLSASDRYAIARAERQACESPPVSIHGQEHPASVLFGKAVEEAIASGAAFRSASGFLKLVGTIEARCARENCWPGEGLERQNGKAPTVAELIAIDDARRAKL